MLVVLVPGLWMAGPSWDRVVPVLEDAGHRAHPMTPPGMGSRRLDRSGITLRDHVDDLVALLDTLTATSPGERVALVAHAEGGALAHAAVDARPELVSRVVHVAGTPRSHGRRGPVLPAVGDEVPMPAWWELDESVTSGLDDEMRTAIEAMAVPVPVGVLTEPQQLHDDRRLDVPVTIVGTTRPTSALRRDLMRAAPGTDDLALLDDVTWVDLPSSHWPQLTHPAELGEVLVAALAAEARTRDLGVSRTG